MGLSPSGDVMGDAKAAINALADFCCNTLGLESHLSALGIGEENFDAMAQAACWGEELKGFKPLNKEGILQIYRMCL